MLDIMLFIIGRKVTIKGIIMQLKRQENECISCFCLYLCSVKLRKECNLLEMSVG